MKNEVIKNLQAKIKVHRGCAGFIAAGMLQEVLDELKPEITRLETELTESEAALRLLAENLLDAGVGCPTVFADSCERVDTSSCIQCYINYAKQKAKEAGR